MNTVALQYYADQTGGKYKASPSGSDLNQIYTDIAGELKEQAGVNVTAELQLDRVNVSGNVTPGHMVFNYVYDPSGTQGSSKFSTGRDMYFGSNNTRIVLPTLNQTSDWMDDQILTFNDIGTIILNETYTISFKLKVNQTGNIEIFGPGTGSTLTFNSGEASLGIPKVALSSSHSLIDTGWRPFSLSVTDPQRTDSGPVRQFIPVKWTTSYTGQKTYEEYLYYNIDGGTWVQFDHRSGIVTGALPLVRYANLPMANLPTGEYRIKVFATAKDAANDAIGISDPILYEAGSERAFIKLE